MHEIDEDIWTPMNENWNGGPHKFHIGQPIVCGIYKPGYEAEPILGVIVFKYDYNPKTEPRYLVEFAGADRSEVLKERDIELFVNTYKDVLNGTT